MFSVHYDTTQRCLYGHVYVIAGNMYFESRGSISPLGSMSCHDDHSRGGEGHGQGGEGVMLITQFAKKTTT